MGLHKMKYNLVFNSFVQVSMTVETFGGTVRQTDL